MKPSSQLLPKLAAPIASAIVVVLDTRGGGAVALAAERPALVVVISVDQMRADYLDRFRPWFGDDGFNRFLKTGASFPNAAYRNAATYTAPDHASIGTGLDPGHHGIIGNSWFDVKLKSPVYCVEDPGEWVVGAAGAGKTPRDPPASPTRLTTVSERRREARLAGVRTAIATHDRELIRRVRTILKPGGILAIDVSDGDWTRQNFEPRSWEWIDRNLFVCRERSISADQSRITVRIILTDEEIVMARIVRSIVAHTK